jgi:hypothetical protein
VSYPGVFATSLQRKQKKPVKFQRLTGFFMWLQGGCTGWKRMAVERSIHLITRLGRKLNTFFRDMQIICEISGNAA